MIDDAQPGRLYRIESEENGDVADTQRCTVHKLRLATSPRLSGLDGRHPCFSSTAEGHRRAGRLHLPVSPACNIECRFCDRKFNAVDERPGVSRGLIRPEDAPDVVSKALELCPSIRVVGIAGPGDTLATPHALRAFELVHARFPELLLCLSTNGLRLEEHAEQLASVGVETVTVTVNAVDSAILSGICSSIVTEGQRLRGIEAADVLIARQLAGIRRAASLGLTVKINSVLVPCFNDAHIGAIAEASAAAGASLINIIPLIPQHELSKLSPPTEEQLRAARQAAAQHLRVFQHCNRCRADACGIPGVSDYAGQLYGASLADGTFSHG